MASNIIFPLQFERQYSGPLDIHQTFNTTVDRNTYLTNPLRYAGQVVSDLETNKLYQLNSTLDEWLEVGKDVQDWMNLVRGYYSEPTLIGNNGSGDVYEYVYLTAVLNSYKTYYRYIATDGSEDAFYENFSGGILSNLVAKKQIII